MITLLLLIASAFAQAAPCGERLLGYTVYEVFEEGKIKEHYSTFPITEWSDASAFNGVVARQAADLTLEAELRHGKFRQVEKFSFASWEKDPAFFAAVGFKGEKFFKDAEDGDSFILRLKSGGKVVCEDPAREVQGD